MDQLTVENVDSLVNRKVESERTHIRNIQDRVLFANFRLGFAELMERTQSAVENVPTMVKMYFNGNDSFRLLSGGDKVGQEELSFRELVELDGEGPRSVMRVLGNSELAKTVKAVQHLHRLHPDEDIMALKKAVEHDPTITDLPVREQVQGIELANRIAHSEEPDRHPDAPVPKLTPGRR